MEELPSDAAAVALALAVAGDAMADLVELAELFDVDVDHLAGPLALVAAGRVGPPPGAQLVLCHALVRRAFLWMSIRLSQGTLTSRQHQLHRPEPDGQPTESSQLAGC